MRPRLALFLSPILCVAFCLHARGRLPAVAPTLRLRFVPVMGGRPLVLYDEAGAAAKDSLRITMLRCYISGISLWQDGKPVWNEPESYHLLDAADPARLRLELRPPAGMRYTTLRFSLGIDSAASTSGAHGGELDPARGMYWAWQSGYINFKLEGTSPQCPTRKHEFHFHLGGYRYPYAAIQPVALAVQPADELAVMMDLSRLLSGIDLARQNSIMIPGAEAAALSVTASRIFQVQQ